MKITFFGIAALTAASFLGGCGTTQTIGAGPPVPTATPTPVPTTAAASGTLVDEGTNAPLAGVAVAVASWAPGGVPGTAAQVATTTGTGAFTFTVPAGIYLMTIGTNSTSGPQATLNVGIDLSAGGAIPLTLPTPAALPNVTFTAAQTSGNFRLMMLTASQQDCLSGANAGRASATLGALIPDEFLEEDVEATLAEEVAQSTFQPNPLFALGSQPFGTINEMVDAATGFSVCDQYTNGYSFGSPSHPPYAYATNGANVWYGGDVNTGASPYYGTQAWSTNALGSSSANVSFAHRKNGAK